MKIIEIERQMCHKLVESLQCPKHKNVYIPFLKKYPK